MKSSNGVSELRHKLNLSQKELASRLGMGGSGERTISGWERGEHNPSSEALARLGALESEFPYQNCNKSGAFTFVDLFAGIGGIRLPFQKLGGKCVFTSEWDQFSQKTYFANFGEKPEGDITKIPSIEIPKHDLLLAGFPCQAFSQAGLKKGFNDTRGTLFFEIQRILAFHRPKVFLLENVKQLRGHDKGRTLRTILAALRGDDFPAIAEEAKMSEEARCALSTKLNYSVGYAVLKANNFGVPQKRERIYILGFDKDFFGEVDVGAIFNQLLERSSLTCLGDILQSDNEVHSKYTISDRLLAGHTRRLDEHRSRGNGFGFSVFSAASPYCNTMSARYYKDGSEILIDQSHLGRNPRKITPREAARIQGFPEDFVVSAVSDTQLYKQMGNSVSVPVIQAIAEKIVPYLAVSAMSKESMRAG